MLDRLRGDVPTSRGSAADRWAASESPVIILSLMEHDYPTFALWRANRLAKVLRAHLTVLRVLPCARPRIARLWLRGASSDPARAMGRTLGAMGATQTWIRDVVQDITAVRCVTIKRGDFVEQTALHGIENRAQLIVVSSAERELGASFSALASLSGIRVLVGREARKHDSILAATDLASPAYPVLRDAAELGQRLAAPVIALHQVDAVNRWGGRARSAGNGSRLFESRTRELATISQHLQLSAHTVVCNDISPTQAILQEARSRDADLVVVGTRSRGRSRRGGADSVCAQVVDHARRSILITPCVASAESPGAPALHAAPAREM